jgi:flavin reductase (DIM6/NTAB) family NADH-FMN oxidoreductase RutF
VDLLAWPSGSPHGESEGAEPAPCGLTSRRPLEELSTAHEHAGTTPFDDRDLRNALGTFATGVAIITTRDANGTLFGLTGNSFSSVSLDPPLVLWSLARTAPSMTAFRAATHFGVSVLGSEHRDLAVKFARSGRDKFAGVPYRLGEYGVPLLDGAVAHFECRIVDRYYGGDHEIYLGHVERYWYEHKPSLVFWRGGYHLAQPLDET